MPYEKDADLLRPVRRDGLRDRPPLQAPGRVDASQRPRTSGVERTPGPVFGAVRRGVAHDADPRGGGAADGPANRRREGRAVIVHFLPSQWAPGVSATNALYVCPDLLRYEQIGEADNL